MYISPYISRMIIIVILILIVFTIFQFFMLVHPFKIKTMVHPRDQGIEYEDVSFKTEDGLMLKGWFMPSNRSNTTIIVCHGYPADKNNLLGFSQFLLKNYNVFLFDFRYFGESEGWYTTGGYKEQKDIEAAVSYLKSREDVSRIGAMGFSLGASTILLSHSPEIDAIVADSPYASMDLMMQRVYFIFPSFTKRPFIWITRLLGRIVMGIDINDISPLDEMKNINAPVLLIHGSKDRQISPKNSQYLYDNSHKNNTELWIIEGARHGWGYAMNQEEYEKRVIGFFDRHLLAKK